MSVRTTADERVDEAREHAQAALLALNEIVIQECWGHDDYTMVRRKELENAFQLAQRLRNVLR